MDFVLVIRSSCSCSLVSLIDHLLLQVLGLMASPKDRGPGKNKRKWKEEEDDALIEVLKDLVNGGTSFKADDEFKPGFLNTDAEKLKAKLPESNLKAQPHVRSRLRHFKGMYNVVHDMVVGSCTSGFGWDLETKSVVAEKENHARANDWRGKPCPYYEDLCIIFGKDCASGKDAQGPKEMKDEVNEEGENELKVEASSGKSRNLGKWVRAYDNLVKGLTEVASILGREIRAASSNISRAIGFDVELSDKCSKLNEELANLGLTTIERHQAVRKIASELKSIDVFFSIPDAERKELVQALL
ncbi:hypothetical protein Cgig2_016449 [Carnegiea gigantea]|uniref:Myb/SANT-like domain-containing protein n=1 Tax=Carnegiea gigantea TaxID=171969 RepID=A0A9Q1K631_9CARY|nr:hypothetical protein Cgig2_016449 [Carnegiea gigantea]